MRRSTRFASALVVSALTAACAEPTATGAAPGERLAALTDEERARFLLGRALFERIATPEEGLGPLFNAERCSGCHDQPTVGGGGATVPVLKATRFVDGTCSQLQELGGDNLQQRVTPLARAAGFGAESPPPEATATVAVVAPPLYGLGLIEAVAVQELERRADPTDADGDGISGRLPLRSDGQVARFGRKGDAVTVREFVESALLFELGFTTDASPVDEAHNGTALPASVDPAPDPEMDAETVGLLTDYIRLLASVAPAPVEGGSADSVRAGSDVFGRVGCARCHTPELTTGDAPEGALRHRTIALYSDLLLHDLGGAESDVCTAVAAPGELRTAPLWGLRLRRSLMHGGTAPDVEAAILQHGGEASAVVAAFNGLEAPERAALLRFLSSL